MSFLLLRARRKIVPLLPLGVLGGLGAKREEKIEADLRDGINYIDSNMTVSNLLKRYMSIVSGRFKTNTLRAYNTAIRRINKSPFSQRYISDIRVSDAKKFFVDLHHQNLSTTRLMLCVASYLLHFRWQKKMILSVRIHSASNCRV